MEPRFAAFRACAGAGTRADAAQRAERAPVRGSQRMKVVVFGATKGIGRALARALAERGDASSCSVATWPSSSAARAISSSAAAASSASVTPVRSRGPGGLRGRARRRRRALAGFEPWSSPPACSARKSSSKRTPSSPHRLLTVELRRHGRVLRERAQAPAGRAAAARCACSARWPASAAASRSMLYGASKAGLSRYLEGLDHKFRAQGLRTVCVKPGFVKTA